MNGVPLGFHGLKEMINIHPLFVHYPIAFLTAASVFYLLGVFVKKQGLLEVGRWMLYSGTVLSALTVWTGLQAAGTVGHDAEVHRIMTFHQNLGYVILAFSVALSAWTLAVKTALPGKPKGAFVAAMILLAVLVAQEADLGGRMVFLKGVGVGSKSMLQTTSHDHGEHGHGDHKH